jgi:hypothetical protein
MRLILLLFPYPAWFGIGILAACRNAVKDFRSRIRQNSANSWESRILANSATGLPLRVLPRQKILHGAVFAGEIVRLGQRT